MTTRSAIGVGWLLGELTYFVMRDVMPRYLVPAIARRWL